MCATQCHSCNPFVVGKLIEGAPKLGDQFLHGNVLCHTSKACHLGSGTMSPAAATDTDADRGWSTFTIRSTPSSAPRTAAPAPLRASTWGSTRSETSEDSFSSADTTIWEAIMHSVVPTDGDVDRRSWPADVIHSPMHSPMQSPMRSAAPRPLRASACCS